MFRIMTNALFGQTEENSEDSLISAGTSFRSIIENLNLSKYFVASIVSRKTSESALDLAQANRSLIMDSPIEKFIE